MKKTIFIVLLFLKLFLYISAEDFSVSGHPYDADLRIIGKKAFYTTGIYEDCIEYESNYSYKIKDDLMYIHLKKPVNKTFLFLKANDYSVLINDKNIDEISGLNIIYKKPKIRMWGVFEGCYIYPPKILKASSFLKGPTEQYPPENLTCKTGGKPWVEGVSGNGIGETITFKSGTGRDIHSIIISIGYVDFNKPYLYKDNSRPKKIRLWFDNKSNHIDIKLQDTPSPQVIHLPTFKDKKITLEILDVYSGRKWEDTCINFLITVSDMKEYFNFK